MGRSRGRTSPLAGAARSAPRSARLPPSELAGEYRFLEPLGRGAEGEVWLAEDLRRDGRLVAWKLLPASRGEEPEEFRRRRGVRHPTLVPVLESGALPAGAGRWFTSAYFPGLPLDRLPEPLDPHLLEAIVRRALEGIAALNDAGLRHGDIKPAHILWREAGGLEVRLIDLGHAAPLDGAAPRRVGTPPYAAPELWRDPAEPGRNTDLYALAMCALERLRGAPVVARGGLAAWRRWHDRGDRGAALAQRTVDPSPELLDAIAASLAPDPADRPRDAAALIPRLHAPPRTAPEAGGDLADPPLVGREEWLAALLRELLADAGAAAIVVAGARGSGRTRALRALAARVRARGGIAVLAALGAAGAPLSARDLSALSQRAGLRVLLVDDVGEEDAPALVAAWERVRALGGAPAARLVLALDPAIPAPARTALAQRLAAVAGPVRELALPGLGREEFAALARGGSLGRAAADRLWRESGGAPAALLAARAPSPIDAGGARAALGEPLASWLAALPTAVPLPVLAAAADLSEGEIWRRFAAAGPLAPAVVGESPRRVLPWPAPREAHPADPAPLAAAWRDADGDTGRWASLVLDPGSAARGDAAPWRAAVAAARRRGDAVALAALATVAPARVDGEWIAREAAARLGERFTLPEDAEPVPESLSSTAAASAGAIVERVRGPAAALPYLLQRARTAPVEERAEALIAAARVAQEAGRAETAAELLAERIDESGLPPAALLDLGALVLRRGDGAHAEHCFRLALERGRRGVDPAAVVGALSGLSGHARSRGDLEGAAARIAAAIRYARRAGLEAERPELALNQGAILHSLRRTDEALAAYRRAERWIAGRPDRAREAHALLGIGTVLRDRGDLLPAIVALHRAVRRARAAAVRPLLAMALGNLGDGELLAGLALSAREHRRELLRIAGEAGEPALLRQARIAAAAAEIATGDPDEAAALLAAAAQRSDGGPRLEAWERSVRADLLDLRGDGAAALRERGGALRAALRSGRAYAAAAALRGIARAVAARGDPDRAGRLIDRGLLLARADPCPPLSRVPLEIERLRLSARAGAAASSVRSRAAELAREAHRLALAEEFLVAAEVAGERLPDDLASIHQRRRARLERRYGREGVRTLALRRGLHLPDGVEGDSQRVIGAQVRSPPEDGDDPLSSELERVRRAAGAGRALCFVAAGKHWRRIALAGEEGHPPDTARLPAEAQWIRAAARWRGWIPYDAHGPAGLWLEGSGEVPRSLDLAALAVATREARARAELDQMREQLRRSRAQVRRLREESVLQREQTETRVLTQRLDAIDDSSRVPGAGAPWLVRSEAMRALVSRLPAWSRSDLPILLWGESGVGKTELLRRLAELRPAGAEDAPFFTENCAALPEPLLEAELFGYIPGAFTGADREQPGLLERCAGGTLVLDHIDELPTALQAKLLHVLDGGTFRPLGGGEERRVDFRLIATVREEPATLVAEGRLRGELYFRLQGIEARVPPLRERVEEIAPLLELYLGLAARALARATPAILPTALAALERAAWPGNVRELVNLCQRFAIEGRGAIRAEDLAPAGGAPPAPPERTWQGADWRSETDRFHRALLAEALERFGGNQTQTARALGISRRHLQNLLNQLGLRSE